MGFRIPKVESIEPGCRARRLSGGRAVDAVDTDLFMNLPEG